MVVKFFFFIVFFSSQNCFGAPAAFYSQAKSLGEGSVHFNLDWGLFNTLGFRDKSGDEVPMYGGESFQKMDWDFSGRYAYSSQFELFSGGRFRQNRSNYFPDREDPQSQLEFSTHAGFESYLFGTRYFYTKEKMWFLALELSFRQSSYANEIYDPQSPPAEIVLGDGGNELRIGLFASPKRRENYTFETALHFNFPSHGRSKEFEYFLAGVYGVNHWVLMGGLQGIASFQTDTYSDDPQGRLPVHRGATFQYNSVNRSYYSPFVQVHFQVTKNWNFKAKIAKRLGGVSTDEGDELSLGITWFLPSKSKKEKLVKEFKEYNIEASVIKISPRGAFITIDKGVTDDVQVGKVFDVYQFDYLGGNVLVASGVIYEASAETAIVKILQTHQNIPIKVGFVVRAR